MNTTIEFLDWIVAMDLAYYKTDGEDTKNGASHWYVKRSLERFTSMELYKIYYGQMDDNLRFRWNWAVAYRNR